MKKKLLALVAFLGLISFSFAIKDARLLRFPDINSNQIVFVYAGDIWRVSANGGEAKRLTSDVGLELFPKISPDGKWIAFSAEYSGSRQVYVMPAKGGTPRQLTYYNDVGIMPPRGGWDYAVLDWTPDSKNILIRANRTPYGRRMGKYYLVSIDGGLETPLEIPDAGFGKFSPDATKIIYAPISREFRTWKRYKGGRAQDVWIYDLVHHTSKQITKFVGTDEQPIWYKDKIYFVSDRKTAKLNFWSYDLKTGEFKQITNHKDYDVLWPSGRGGLVVYENGGYIYKLNLNTGKTQKLTINIDFDDPNVLPHFKNVSKFVSRFGYAVSPTGKRAVFDARGDIFTVPAKEGITYDLTNSQGIKETYPRWSPDGKWIAIYSDRTGEYEIYLIDPKGKKKPVQLTKNTHTWRYPVVWSPNSKKLLFYDKTEQKLEIFDVETRKITNIDSGVYSDITDYDWSPESDWVIYTNQGKNGLNAVWVYSLKGSKKYQLTDNRFNEFSPVFSKDGKYIFFLSMRDFNMKFSSYEFDFVYNKAARIYAVALTKDAPRLFKEKNDVETLKPEKSKTKKTEEKGKKSPSKAKEIKIDFQGINDRIVSFPLKPDNYLGIAALKDGILYFKDGAIYKFNIDKKKSSLIIKGIRGGDLAADGKHLLYKAGSKYGIIEIKPNQKVGAGQLNLKDVTMKINPKKEWEEMYRDGWRIYRDWFYVKNMHGVNWEAMYKKYRPLVNYVSHRADLDYIFGELVSELNVGHCYVHWGDFKRPKRIDTGLLGAELKADKKAGRYRIVKIYKGENWNKELRSPLTEQGINVKEGDYIIKLNKHEVTIKDNPYKFLENTVGKRIPITVNSKPIEKGARTYLIKPIKSELALFHFDWVNSRKKLVDKLSGGRIGYIYVPDTAVEGNTEFFKSFYALRDKDALIIDERYNGGGWSPGKMIDLLSRKVVSYWHTRGHKLTPEPFFAVDGPKAMLINHYASSGGDNFPYWFRKAKLGPIIGTRSWGGLVGYGWSPSLVDGADFAVPGFAIVGTTGKWVVEGVGIYPDITVEDRPEEVAKGRDPSVETAVKYLLEQLKKHPTKKVKKSPKEPDRSKWYEGKIK